MKKFIYLVLSLIIIAGFAGCTNEKASTAVNNTNTKAAAAKKTSTLSSGIISDSYIIFNLSYNEAITSSSNVKVNKEPAKTTYNFNDLVLSCGTHMNGTVEENIKDDTKTLTGSFNVTKNPYAITALELNVSINTKTSKKTGYFIVNGKKFNIDEKLLQVS